jgi:hypothetical protein
MPTPTTDNDPLPADGDRPRPVRRPLSTQARFRQIVTLLQDPLADPAPVPSGLRFDRPQVEPPRPHLAISANRVWTEILNSAIGDDADTSLIHDLASLHPQVTAEILRAVNSAQGGVIRRIQEVGLAIELLGLRRLRSLALENRDRTAAHAVTSLSVDS